MDNAAIAPCDVWELARQRGEVEGDLQLSDAPRLAAELVDTAGALHFRMTGLTDERGRPAARMQLDGEVKVRCDRCGEALAVPIRERAEFFFVEDEATLARLPIDEAPEEPLLGSHRFDLAALIEDQALLALPISPRHAACAIGAAPAEESENGQTHRPFAALAALKPRRR
jgi:uncharacterized protein